MASLKECVFAITGKLSKLRAEITKDIEEAGGVVKSSVTKDVTHLLANSEDGKETTKMIAAREKGIKVVDEAWLQARLAGGEPMEDEEDKDEEDEEDKDEEAGEASLEGCVFAITGKLSKLRAEVTADIGAAGGVVKSSVTKDVTHLLANSEDGKETTKMTAAREKGIEVVDEAWLQARLAGGGPMEDEDDQDEEDAEDGGDAEAREALLEGCLVAITG